ncbi:hypothetical protein JI739_07650 [Ramlibacter sp. AW1]|uniref:Uncharacterized protein n=1 Tax=Ramlibacter aurantiacus TaxID=2801330 RepID=A0A937D2Z3_9BURK|nr:hypothetical protein [Ramlibacter aurantiacus]MBL0420215.1 hypothetical protein [Ramlibacter aurantiacus]
MALLRKAVMLAITSGIAKKAWDAYRNKHPMEAARAKANLKEAGRNLSGKASGSDVSSRTDRPGPY